MAYVVPTNVATGDVLTAATWNQSIVENSRALRGDFAMSRYTTGNITINSTNWTNLGGPADLVLAADAGDLVSVDLSMLISNEAVDEFLDVVTVVSGSPVNAFGNATTPSNTHQGILSWRATGSVYTQTGGTFWYKLVSGDISSSTVTLRLRARTGGATNKINLIATDYPAVFMARNHGPVEV